MSESGIPKDTRGGSGYVGPVLLTDEDRIFLDRARVSGPHKQLNRGVRGPCTVCLLPVGCRKIAEGLIRQGCSVREVAEYLNWYLTKHPETTSGEISRSAVSRHKVAAHFAIIQPTNMINKPRAKEIEMLSLREFTQEAFRRFQLARGKDWSPTYNELIALMGAEVKLSEQEQKRSDDEYLKGLVTGISFVKTKTEDGVPSPI